MLRAFPYKSLPWRAAPPSPPSGPAAYCVTDALFSRLLCFDSVFRAFVGSGPDPRLKQKLRVESGRVSNLTGLVGSGQEVFNLTGRIRSPRSDPSHET